MHLILQEYFDLYQLNSHPMTKGKAMTCNILVSCPLICCQPMRVGGYLLLLY